MLDAESTADADAPVSRSGWVGNGEPMTVGPGCTRRGVCDGLSLASPGRWPVSQRKFPRCAEWLDVAERVRAFTRREGLPELLMRLALRQEDSCPFHSEAIRTLTSRGRFSSATRRTGQICRSTTGFWNYCWMSHVGLGNFAQDVRI